MDFKDMKDTINGEEWEFEDRFFMPEIYNGKWTVSLNLFKFLKVQYEAIEKGWAFRFAKDDMGTGRTVAFLKCSELVEKLNDLKRE